MDYQAQRTAQAAATRKAIMDAAAQLVREGGFEKMSVRELCRRAGVTTGAFYHHFPSKEALVTRGSVSVDSYLEEAMAGVMDQPPLQRLEHLLRSFAGYVEGLGWQSMSLYYAHRLYAPAATAISPDRFTLREMVRCFEELSGQGVLSSQYTPQWAADFCFRHFRGVVVDWIIHQGSYPLWDKLEPDYALFAQAFVA